MTANAGDESVVESTTSSVKAAAEPPPSTPDPSEGDGKLPVTTWAGLDIEYRLGTGVTRPGIATAPDRRADDPVFRPLRIYTIDPEAIELEGAVDAISVPYERLTPGPVGRLLEIDSFDPAMGRAYSALDLDSPTLVMQQGVQPTPSDPRFHQQMVYAVCSQTYAVFQRALGRQPDWGFDPAPGPIPDGERLRVRPFAMREPNARYDKTTGSLDFGYFTADDRVTGTNLPGGFVFTALAHDVVVHEMTHALLDGMRAHFTIATGPDVPAFHEGFADLIAIFQHFSYRRVVREALRQARGRLDERSLLTELAVQLGHTTSASRNARAMRSAIVPADETRPVYDPGAEPHVLGTVLLNAVFETYGELFRRRTERYLLLATGGTGTLPPGQLPVFLLDILADEASKLAEQFLSILIRAVDYCPPVDVQLGEYLRAIITADRELVTSDPLRYRATFTRIFGSYGLHPPDVRYLSEDELCWRSPDARVEPIQELAFAELRFRGDPAHAASRHERRRQACALGRVVAQPRHRRVFGLAVQGDPDLNGDTVDLPCIESVRTTRRIGPDAQLQFDLVAEVTQRRLVRHTGGSVFEFFGGSTVIIDPLGCVRYVIRKSVLNTERLERQREYVRGAGRAFWSETGDMMSPERQPFALLHRQRYRREQGHG